MRATPLSRCDWIGDEEVRVSITRVCPQLPFDSGLDGGGRGRMQPSAAGFWGICVVASGSAATTSRFISYPSYRSYHIHMGKTKLKQEAVYLMPEKHELLLELAKKTRISRSELLREAVDDLLKKHGVLKVARRKL
jgi:hypothetical protein